MSTNRVCGHDHFVSCKSLSLHSWQIGSHYYVCLMMGIERVLKWVSPSGWIHELTMQALTRSFIVLCFFDLESPLNISPRNPQGSLKNLSGLMSITYHLNRTQDTQMTFLFLKILDYILRFC